MNDSTIHSRIGDLGIWSPELRGARPAALDAATELDEAGWGALWLPTGSDRRSMWDDAEDLLEHTRSLAVAFGVIGIWGADAATAAARRARIEARYGRRVLSGFGVSSPGAAAANGKSFSTPLRAMNDFLDVLDADSEGVPIGERIIGGLGPKMVALAGQRAAGVHPFLVTPDGTARDREILGGGKIIAPYMPVTLEPDPTRARENLRRYVGIFVGFPSYQANLRRLGFGDADLVAGGSDFLIDSLSAWGSVEAIDARIREHRAAGADHVAIHVLDAEPGLPLTSWRELSALLPVRSGE